MVKKFEELYAKSPQEATDYFYKLSQDSNYIRRYRIANAAYAAGDHAFSTKPTRRGYQLSGTYGMEKLAN